MTSEATRYGDTIAANASRMRYPGLVRRLPYTGVEQVFRAGHGLVTVSSSTAGMPDELLHAIATFRLGEYLSLRYASPEVAWRRGLHCEPVATIGPKDHHLVTFEETTGRILGYVCLATNGDPTPQPLGAGRRARRYPVERAHDIDVFATVGSPARSSAEVREIKRFVHARSMRDRATRLRVTVDLLRGLVESKLGTCAEVSVLVGDVEEEVALRHLVLMGLDVDLVSGTEPGLATDDLMGPMYVTRQVVEPFHALVPGPDEVAGLAVVLREIAEADEVFEAATGRLMRRGAGRVIRHDVHVERRRSA